MKKSWIVTFFAFWVVLLLGGSDISVNAYHNVWDFIRSYEIDEEASSTRYYFDNESDSYNFKFHYDYRIKSSVPIRDGYDNVYYFYGTNQPISISYVNLPDGGFLGTGKVNDRMAVYSFNYTTQEFEPITRIQGCAPRQNESGECVLPDRGIYKIVTDGVSGTVTNTPITYIFYETELYYMNIDNVTFFNQKQGRDYPSVEVNLTIKDPRGIGDINVDGLKLRKYNETNSMSIDYDADVSVRSSDIQNNGNAYNVQIIADMSEVSNKVVKNVNVVAFVSGTQVESLQTIDYDMVNPRVHSLKYYNIEHYLDGFYKTYVEGQPLMLPGGMQGALAEIIVHEDSDLINNEVSLNGTSCTISELDDESLQGKYYSITCLITASLYAEAIENGLNYTIIDSYGNQTSITHDNVGFSHQLFEEDYDIGDYVSIDQGIVRIQPKSGILKACMFYGGDSWRDAPSYECGIQQIVPSYTYTGDVQVLIFNSSLFYDEVILENVTFTNGYDESLFVEEDIVVNLDNHSIDIYEDMKFLIEAACSGSICRDTDHSFKFTIKVGDLPEADMEFDFESTDSQGIKLDFLELLNIMMRQADSAKISKNIEVKITLNYVVGPTKQHVSMIYKFVDEFPNLIEAVSLGNVQLEYKQFNATSSEFVRSLYGDELEVTLKDKNNVYYRGQVISRFVSYIDRAGNVRALNNESITYISEQSSFGYYILECRIKLLQNITDNVVYETALYGKSFFIQVELKDSIVPTLTLLGDKEVQLKQHDVFKDLGAKCDDASGCVVITTYYFNSQDNEVEEIDTSKIGKYIIKYVAKDGDGNLSVVETRTVIVTGVNALDTTSIIVIASVVLVFILIVTFAIIMEIRKNKKMKNFN